MAWNAPDWPARFAQLNAEVQRVTDGHAVLTDDGMDDGANTITIRWNGNYLTYFHLGSSLSFGDVLHVIQPDLLEEAHGGVRDAILNWF